MKKIIWLILLIPQFALALSNDKYGRTVTVNTVALLDVYTDVDPNNGNSTFIMSFPTGTPIGLVYPKLESIAPPNVANYAGLDASGNVVLIQNFVTTTIMDALVSGGSISSYAQLDPNFPSPNIGDTYAAGTGSGNFMKPAPYLPATSSNWPPPGGVPLTVPQALDQIANRLSTINPQSPARSLNTNFTPNANRPVFACYTISMSCSITVGGSCTGTVQLLSDTNSTPVTVRSQTTLSTGGTIVVGLTLTDTQEVPLCYMVPKGHNVRLASSGTATISITVRTEEPLN